MSLSNLKPAWRHFRLVNSMQPVSREEILRILESGEEIAVNKTHRFLMNTLVFVVFTFSHTGG